LEAGTLRNICSLENPLREVVIRRTTRKADPLFPWGRPMIPWKKQVRAHGMPPG
jgi:hypothetical protein